MENNTGVPQERSNKGRMQLLIGSLVVLIPTAFFGTKYAIKKLKEKFKNKQKNDNDNQTPTDLDIKIPVQANTNSVPRTSVRPAATGATFPLNLRAKGNKVLELQQSLMRTYGSGIFPKHGADGDFGSELASFLRGKGYGIPLSEADYNKITQAQTQTPTPLVAFDPAAIAKGVYNAIMGKDYSSAITLLKAITNPTNYSLVSEKFKLYRINGGVRQSLVTAMLNSFSEKSQKENTRMVFQKMGLQYNAATDKWSLA